MALIRDYSPVLAAQKSFRSATNHIDKEILDKDLIKAREALLKYGVMRVPGPSKDNKGAAKSTTASRPKTAGVRESNASVATIATTTSNGDSESTLTSEKKKSRVSSAFKGISRLASKGSSVDSPTKTTATPIEEYTLQDWCFSKVIFSSWFKELD